MSNQFGASGETYGSTQGQFEALQPTGTDQFGTTGDVFGGSQGIFGDLLGPPVIAYPALFAATGAAFATPSFVTGSSVTINAAVFAATSAFHVQAEADFTFAATPIMFYAWATPGATPATPHTATPILDATPGATPFAAFSATATPAGFITGLGTTFSATPLQALALETAATPTQTAQPSPGPFGARAILTGSLFKTDVSPDTASATPSWDTPTISFENTVIAPSPDPRDATFDPGLAASVAFPRISITAEVVATGPTTTILYNLIPYRTFVSAPTFVRWRHRYRGQRESYKFNAEISSFYFDVIKLYEKYVQLGVTFNEHITTMIRGGSIDAIIVDTVITGSGSAPVAETFGADNVDFGDTGGTFGEWDGVPTQGQSTIVGSVPFTIIGHDAMSERIERLRHRVSQLERR